MTSAATPLIDVQDLTTAFGTHVVHENLNLKIFMQFCVLTWYLIVA